jgi:hypothetical protein
MDVIVMTSLKYYSKVRGVIYSLARVNSEIIEVRFENILEIVKRKGRGALRFMWCF